MMDASACGFCAVTMFPGNVVFGPHIASLSNPTARHASCVLCVVCVCVLYSGRGQPKSCFVIYFITDWIYLFVRQCSNTTVAAKSICLLRSFKNVLFTTRSKLLHHCAEGSIYLLMYKRLKLVTGRDLNIIASFSAEL